MEQRKDRIFRCFSSGATVRRLRTIVWHWGCSAIREAHGRMKQMLIVPSGNSESFLLRTRFIQGWSHLLSILVFLVPGAILVTSNALAQPAPPTNLHIDAGATLAS